MGRIQGVIFDAVGTIVRITNPRHPYRQLLKIGVVQGRRPTPCLGDCLRYLGWWHGPNGN
ncbi:haloacid dehalogenase-like family hydrolase [Pseudomonas luteola]|uniref:Haloacid dehalogenase-like family hydrolase n=1 Tax=Pseudomonas luteola TaxID=47886 RepID=A0A2X2C417_PSELU|nr:hypothetical protein SAMN05216295_1314 [Pseudomonas zeshuii]SPZ00276.1 haloacid dehalogenase-like family hydrolase [Pseudomonas luteola]